ncbi:leucine-rich repeat-containing protein 42 [Eurytemora carolleeae]|uniref:leucine-rich repeat-containing protein 42 n=1 Tax=Eurytemora carolleeae TaxID=1294199 RepID=UPI000C78F4E6|nr:leucine-rich repeat-containing protein 42 [Eurytemora carolleeae]|eukprot:XP_023346006.1 leucine-rich repeat-containing protein 42-like [Eurytemora affinis]
MFFNPVSLFDQCFTFVGKHMNYIDSLIGFPPEFSTRILDTGIQEGLFDTDTAIDILRMYGESTDEFRALSLSNIMVLNEFEMNIQGVLQTVHKLDLSHLQLDDEHEILSWIPELEFLQVLILDQSNISDRGMKKITYPAFAGKKLANLHYLDISGLHLSLKFFKTLKHVTQLQTLIVDSETCIDDIPGFSKVSRPQLEQVRMSSILIKLLERWTALTMCRRKQKHILHNSTFYSKPLKPNTQILNTDSQEVTRNKIMLRRSEEIIKTTLNSRKRIRLQDNMGRNKMIKLEKNSPIENIDLLSLYQ